MTRSRVAVLAVLAITASVLVYSPAVHASTHEQAPDAGVHQPAVDALNGFGWVFGVDVFSGTGCADSDELCPQEPLLRWEMAAWLARILDQGEPPAVASSRFADVTAMDWWRPHVERLAELGIVTGCGTDPLTFCPDEPIERGQMATFLATAFDLPATERAGFSDVPGDHAFAADINRITAARITAGCAVDPARFCPQRHVTRGETATLLARAIGVVDPPPPIVPVYAPELDATPLPTDPAVRIGTLENGLTYYLRHNEHPGENLDLRLLVDVGSVNETDDNTGIAHFIEHMLFNGTEDYPGNSMGATLREIGVELGPDLNAYVSHDETAYRMDVNTVPGSNVTAVFHALSQMAHAATFDADAVESERGVVLDEQRIRRETSSGYISSEFDRIYTQGTPYENRDPAGTLESVSSMTAEDLKTFYETWYVPSNMAVVAVGDWTVDALEALVVEHFGTIPPGDAPPFEAVRVTPDPEPSTYVVTDDEQAYSYISLDIPIPLRETGTVGGERLYVMQVLIELMVANRLTDAYHRGELSQVDPPEFHSFNYNDALHYYGTNWQGEDLDSAFTDYLSVLLTAQEHGFTDSELARVTQQVTAALEFQLDSAATTMDRQYAQRYVNHFLRNSDIGTVEDRVARISALLSELAADELTEHYRWLMDRAGPVVIAVGPDPASVPTTEGLDAAVDAAAAGPPPVEETEVDRLLEEPTPVEPVSSGPLELIHNRPGYEWTFANGARVMFVESDISEGAVFVQSRSHGGWSLLEPGSRALSPRAVEAVLSSGAGDLTRSQINRFLEDSTASLGAFIGETSEGYSGSASTNDVETVFQLLHLFATSPQVDEAAFLDALNGAERRTSLAEVNPDWQAWVAYIEARYGLAWHRPVATREQLASLTPDALLAIFKDRLTSVDDMVVAVVGDVDVEEIGRLARQYIGTLPAGDSETYINHRPPMTEEVVRREVTVDEGESAVLEVYHESVKSVTPLGSVAATVLETALSERLFLVVREELGASYSARAIIDPVAAPVEGYESLVYVTLDPERFDEIHAAVMAIVDDVATNGLSPEEYAQAVAIVGADYSKTSNGDLLNALLSRHMVDDEDIFTPQRRIQELADLTAADVQAIAAAIYGEGGRIEIVSKP